MKKSLLFAAIAAAAIPMTPSLASAPGYHIDKATVVQRNAAGRATEVKVGDTLYAVCEGKVQDECINPRQAGLHFGDAPLSYWPGEPASQLDHNNS
jgi:hypothetical protein